VLGREVGDYRHHAISLHIYERDWGKVEEFDVADKTPNYPPGYTYDPTDLSFQRGVPFEEDTAVSRWREAREQALAVITGDRVYFDGAQWYDSLLAEHRTSGMLCVKCRYFYNPDDEDAVSLHGRGDCFYTNR
jgi:hypothetical protein